MGIRQVEKLYKKIARVSRDAQAPCISAEVRAAIFGKIMEDLERLMRRIERCEPDSRQYKDLDFEIRSLLLKEIQVIIDDYILCRRNGTLLRWKKMYGDIEHYVADFYRFRASATVQPSERPQGRYGFYQDEQC